MSNPFLDRLQRNPQTVDQSIVLRDGTHLDTRLHRSTDGERLAHYFTHLSEATRRVYGPHPFTAEQAHAFCRDVNYADTLRFLALDEERIVAYFVLHLGVLDSDVQRYASRNQPLNHRTDSTLAPSVADRYQERGVGSALFPLLSDIATQIGRRRIVLWGGVRADNPRAVHFYRKMGFVEQGQFATKDTNNYDMLLDL